MAYSADEILAELKAHRLELKTIFASGQEANSLDAARQQDADAKSHAASAVSHLAAAKAAKTDGDDEDAASHYAKAKQARMDAAKCRAAAKAAYAASAKSLAASDETASKAQDAEAARLEAEEQSAAKMDKDADDEMAQHAEDAAAKKKTMTPNILPMFAMFLKAMTQDGNNMDAMKDAGNLQLLKDMMDAMTYPAGGPRFGSKRSQSAAHDDTAEDTALFRRLIKQYKDDGDLSAAGVTDLRMERKLRAMEAAMGAMKELLTDVVHSLKDLATDGQQTRQGLATDSNRGQNGGPVRKTMSATGTEQFRGKFDDVERDGQGQQTMAQIDAALDEQGLSGVERMAAKLAMGWQNQVKQ